jgi:hypothetical protein
MMMTDSSGYEEQKEAHPIPSHDKMMKEMLTQLEREVDNLVEGSKVLIHIILVLFLVILFHCEMLTSLFITIGTGSYWLYRIERNK